MSMYNRLFGENKEATALLGMISCTRDLFMRYRDVYLNTKGDKITVLTRVGGGNRKDYRQVFTNIRRNPNYIRDYDDLFDKTYCYFEFNIPDKYKDVCKKMAPKEEVPSVGDKFKQEIEESKIDGSDAQKRMAELANEIFGNIENGNHFIGL